MLKSGHRHTYKDDLHGFKYLFGFQSSEKKKILFNNILYYMKNAPRDWFLFSLDILLKNINWNISSF